MREESAQFEATISNCEEIGAFVRQFAQETALSDEQVYNLQIAVEEHIVNLIEHAFKQQTGEIVTVVCQDNTRRVQVKIMDASAGFDPRNYSIPDIETIPVGDLTPGGFGNYFISELMDEVEYIHQPYNQNILILTVYPASHSTQQKMVV